MTENNIFEKLTAEEQTQLWMYMIFNRDKIIEKTEQWTREAEKAGMTLTEYLESINPLNKSEEFHCGVEESGGHAYNCNDCPNKCDEWYQWDKEIKNE